MPTPTPHRLLCYLSSDTDVSAEQQPVPVVNLPFAAVAVTFVSAEQQPVPRGEARADALGSVLQVHVGRFWGLLDRDTFLVSDLNRETGFGLLSPS